MWRMCIRSRVQTRVQRRGSNTEVPGSCRGAVRAKTETDVGDMVGRSALASEFEDFLDLARSRTNGRCIDYVQLVQCS